MDRQLEEWIDKKLEPVKENWLEEKDVSVSLLSGLGAENSIEQMIWDIDNSNVRDILAYNLNENLRTREELKKEIAIYYQEIEPRLWDKDLNKMFNLLVTARRTLPSFILKEFGYRDQILAESDPKVKELMEISLKHDKFPSLVLNGKDFYKKFAEVKDEESRNIIVYYLGNWLSPRLVNDEYEDYLDIKNYEYKNEDLKNFLLSLIAERKADPSIIAFFFDIFKDYIEFWDEQKIYIMRLINKPL